MQLQQPPQSLERGRAFFPGDNSNTRAEAWGAKVLQFRLAPLWWTSYSILRCRCCQVAAALHWCDRPLPRCTDLIQHHNEMHPGLAVCSQPYLLPEPKRKVVQEELAAKLEMGVIEESKSAWWPRRMGLSGPVWTIARWMMFHNFMPTRCPALTRLVGHGSLFHKTGIDQGLLADSLVSRV